MRWVFCRAISSPLYVEVGDLEGVPVYELSPRFHAVAHEPREYVVGLHGVLYGHLQKAPLLRVHRRLPELVRVHLAEALVPLDGQALLPEIEYVVHEPLVGPYLRFRAVVLDGEGQGPRFRHALYQSLEVLELG